jgi:deoxycytidine triphosphate deaminase
MIITGNRLKDVVRSCMSEVDPSLVGECSVDVRLGNSVWVQSDVGIIDMSRKNIKAVDIFKHIHVEVEVGFYLQPHEFIRTETLEKFHMVDGIRGMFTLTSRLAQLGLDHSSSFHIRPNWPGDKGMESSTLALELFNSLKGTMMILRPGVVIGQISFETTTN